MTHPMLKCSLAALAFLMAGCAQNNAPVSSVMPSDAPVAPLASTPAIAVQTNPDVPMIGDTFENSVVVGRFAVPLLAGKWVVTNASVRDTKDVRKARVSLVQFRDGMPTTLSNAVTIETNLDANHTNFSSESEDSYAGDKYSANNPAQIANAYMTSTFHTDTASIKKKPRGFTATPSLMFVAPVKMLATTYGVDYITANKLSFNPQDIFTQIGFQVVAAMFKLSVSYYIDPAAQHIAPSTMMIEESKWSPANAHLLTDSDKAFIDKAKAYALDLQKKIVDCFHNPVK